MPVNTSLLDIPSVDTFVGRKSEYKDLSQAIQENRIVFVEGLSGIGKSALVSYYAQSKAADYDAIVWHEIQDDDGVKSIVDSVSEQFKAQGQDFLYNTVWGQQKNAHSIIKALLDQLRRAKTLLIFDSFEKLLNDNQKIKSDFEDLIDDLFKASFSSKVLLTTKIKPQPHPSLLNQYCTFELKGLTGQDTIDLLLGQSKKHDVSLDSNNAHQIYKITEGHPMALNFIIASLIHGTSFQILVKDLQNVVVSEVAPFLLRSLYPKLNPDSQKLLKSVSAFRKPFTTADVKPLPVKTDFTELKSFFFLEIDSGKKQYSLHPIVREYAYKKLREDQLMFKITHKSIGDYYIGKIRAARNPERFETMLDVLEATYYCNKGNYGQGQDFIGNFISKKLKTALRNLVKFGEGKLAKKLYEIALKVTKDDGELHQFYARLLEEHYEINPNDIEKHYAEAVRLSPENPERQMDYLVFLAKTGKYKLAQQAFEQAILLTSCKSSDKVYVPYAKVLLEARKNNDVEKILGKALPVVKKDSLSQVYIMYSQALAYQRKFEQAEASFNIGLKTVPAQNGLDDVYIRYCKYFVQRKRFDKATSVITEAMTNLPPKNLVRLYVEYSKLLRQQRRFQEAIEILEDGIKKIPPKFNLYSLYWEYFDLLKSQKNIKGATEVLKRGIEHVSCKYKGDALILEYSKIQRNLGNWQEAEKSLKYGIENTPIGEGLKILYLDYSNVLLYQGKYDEAVLLLDQALIRLPKRSHSVIKRKRSEILEEKGKRHNAQKQTSKIAVQDQYFEKGQHLEPYLLIRNLIQSATTRIVIVDSYINDELIKLIATLDKKPSILIFGNNISPADFGVQINKLRNDGYKIKVFKTNIFHDRFLNVDSK